MANLDNAMGMIPMDSPQESVERNVYSVTDDYASDLFVGDPVIRVAAGTVEIATASGTYILGSITGFFDETGTPQNYYPASSTAGWTMVVADSPSQLFMIQEGTNGTNVALADRGSNVELVAGTGSTVTGLSKWEIDPTYMDTDAGRQMKIIRKHDTPGNEVGNNCVWVCKINYHQNESNVAGI